MLANSVEAYSISNPSTSVMFNLSVPDVVKLSVFVSGLNVTDDI